MKEMDAKYTINFILPVPDASVPAVDICSDRSDAGITETKQIQQLIYYIVTSYLSLHMKPCNFPRRSLLDGHR